MSSSSRGRGKRPESKGLKKHVRRTRSTILRDFILKNPGMTAGEISEGLGWSRRSVRLALAKLERAGEVSTRYFPVLVKEAGEGLSRVEEEIALGKMRLEKMLERLRAKADEAFERCVEAKMAKDEDLASIYAGRCAEIKRLINSVVASESILNRMALAMDSLRLSIRRKGYPEVNP
ncbi:helix-turn-helix transcriptional regulator [Candidatus Bathyarchaeota archaeon]|nr:helix-turn-helix transcriptional regulator [Candidatus Bathyarchaeota archaeon]